MLYQHNCPSCGCSNTVKKGRTYYGKARAKCKKCGCQFVLIRQYPPLSSEQKQRIELLLAEQISLEGICRVLEIKAHQLYAEIPSDWAASVRQAADIELVCLKCEADELCGAARAELCSVQS